MRKRGNGRFHCLLPIFAASPVLRVIFKSQGTMFIRLASNWLCALRWPRTSAPTAFSSPVLGLYVYPNHTRVYVVLKISPRPSPRDSTNCAIAPEHSSSTLQHTLQRCSVQNLLLRANALEGPDMLSNSIFYLLQDAPLLRRICKWPVLEPKKLPQAKRGVIFFFLAKFSSDSRLLYVRTSSFPTHLWQGFSALMSGPR